MSEQKKESGNEEGDNGGKSGIVSAVITTSFGPGDNLEYEYDYQLDIYFRHHDIDKFEVLTFHTLEWQLAGSKKGPIPKKMYKITWEKAHHSSEIKKGRFHVIFKGRAKNNLLDNISCRKIPTKGDDPIKFFVKPLIASFNREPGKAPPIKVGWKHSEACDA